MRKQLTLAVLLLGACTQGKTGGSPDLPARHMDLAQAADLSASPDLSTPDLTVPIPDLRVPADLAGYPAGPYGYNEGDTLSPMAWFGYSVPKGDVIANTVPYGNFTVNDIRLSGVKLALIHSADTF